MRIRILLFLVALSATTVVADSQTITAGKRALIDELLTLTRGSELAAEFSVQFLSAAQGELPGTHAEVSALRKQFAADPEHAAVVARLHTSYYNEHFTETQLRELVKFLKSDVGGRFIEAQLEVSSAGRAHPLLFNIELPKKPEDSKTKQTRAGIRSIATAAEAYATDNNFYPAATTMEALAKIISPIYIRTVPMNDGWGNPYRYVRSADQFQYRLVSGGPDGKIEAGSLTIGGKAQRSNDDLIYQNGSFEQGDQ